MNTDAHDSAANSDINLLNPDVQRCPFATYRQLREEKPVYCDPMTGMYIVTRYTDIKKIAANPQVFRNNTGQLQNRVTPASGQIDAMMAEADLEEVNTLVTNDPPDHRRYRSLVDKAFAGPRVKAITPRIAEIANDLIDNFPQRPFDFVQLFAILLPMRMIAEQLGVPPAMSQTFKLWSDATIEATNPNIDPQRQIECARLKIDMNRFLADRGEALKKAPDDTLISTIANLTLDGEPLTRGEFCSLLVQLLVGGNETTTSALASGVYHLATRPELQMRLRAEPEKIATFCEEVLRLESPLQGLFRLVAEDTEIGGVEIPAGSILNVRWAAGNRDPDMFVHPDAIDLDRPNAAQHLSFGFGIHYCLGNQLARAELQNGFRLLLQRSRNIRLADAAEGAQRLAHFIAYGFQRLDVIYERC